MRGNLDGAPYDDGRDSVPAGLAAAFAAGLLVVNAAFRTALGMNSSAGGQERTSAWDAMVSEPPNIWSTF